jgi:hypothetical protein
MKLSKESFKEISEWIHRNARALEVSMWRYFFEGGHKKDIITELEYYQNSDGGFGNALEPDNWNPDSTPYTTLYAINIMKKIEFDDFEHKIYKGIFDYLKSMPDYSEDTGWSFSVPGNDFFPHAPWWQYNPEQNKKENIGLTAEICAFCLDTFDGKDTLFASAKKMAAILFSFLKTRKEYGELGIYGYHILLDSIKGKNIFPENEILAKQAKIKELVNDSIENDISKWAYYGVRPSNYIKTPHSIFFPENKEIVEKELDYLIETKPENSVWGINWSWFDNNEQYKKEFSISENWWKSIMAIDKVLFLKNFKRIER